jgi:hypothetical protein
VARANIQLTLSAAYGPAPKKSLYTLFHPDRSVVGFHCPTAFAVLRTRVLNLVSVPNRMRVVRHDRSWRVASGSPSRAN